MADKSDAKRSIEKRIRWAAGMIRRRKDKISDLKDDIKELQFMKATLKKAASKIR